MKTRFIILFLLSFGVSIAFAQKDETVCVTKSGSKYHKSGCSYLKGGCIEMKLSEASALYSACSRCWSSSNTPSSETKQNFTESESKSETKPSTEPKPETGTDKATNQTTKSGQTIYEGPRGGHYHYSKSGKKVYEKKK